MEIKEILEKYKKINHKKSFKKMIAIKTGYAYSTIDKYWFAPGCLIPVELRVKVSKYLDLQIEVDKKVMQLENELNSKIWN